MVVVAAAVAQCIGKLAQEARQATGAAAAALLLPALLADELPPAGCSASNSLRKAACSGDSLAALAAVVVCWVMSICSVVTDSSALAESPSTLALNEAVLRLALIVVVLVVVAAAGASTWLARRSSRCARSP
ncbi:MAG: hypothetical protein QM722_07090 [Piscinibacter sp.]